MDEVDPVNVLFVFFVGFSLGHYIHWCCGKRMRRNSVWDCCTWRGRSRQSHVSNISTGGSILIIGDRVTSDHTFTPADRLELVALDKDGEKLESFSLPLGTHITLNVTAAGSITEARVSQGDLTVKSCQDITTLKASQGSINIDKAGNIGDIKASQGSITIKACQTVRNTKAAQGDINISARERSPRR
jgi:hypothetical protein